MKVIIFIILFCLAANAKDWNDIDLKQLDQLVQSYIDSKLFPGAVIGIYQKDLGLPIYRSYGHLEYPGDVYPAPVKVDTIYDIASVSKVVGATTAAMILYEKSLLSLDEKVAFYLPGFGLNNKETITIRNLLLHNSGLPADAPLFDKYWTRTQVIAWLYNCTLDYQTGTQTVYSDLSMVALQLVIEEITSQSLDVFLNQNVYSKLDMKTTQFNPPHSLIYKIAPTQYDNIIRHEQIWGIVHDPTAYDLGGVSGNAGIFSTVEDLMKFMLFMLNESPVKLVSEATLHYWTQSALLEQYQNTRALGWDTIPIQQYPPCGHKFSQNSFGHTGYTGTSVWADWDKQFTLIMLTNRVYPSDGGKEEIKQFRSEASDLILGLLGY